MTRRQRCNGPGVTTRAEVLRRLGPPEELRRPAVFERARLSTPQHRRILEAGDVFGHDAYTYASARRRLDSAGLLPLRTLLFVVGDHGNANLPVDTALARPPLPGPIASDAGSGEARIRRQRFLIPNHVDTHIQPRGANLAEALAGDLPQTVAQISTYLARVLQ